MKYHSFMRNGRFCIACKSVINPVLETCQCNDQNKLTWTPATITTTVKYRDRPALVLQIIDEIMDGKALEDLSSDEQRVLEIIDKYTENL